MAEPIVDLPANNKMYQLVCKGRLDQLENDGVTRDKLLLDIHAKVTNGFGERIGSVDSKVDELKKDTNKKIDDLKVDMDNRFDEARDMIKGIKRASNAALIAIIVAVLGAAGMGIAAILTGLFGILEKIGAG